MKLLPPEITEIVLSNYPLIIASLVGYFVVFFLISYWAKRRLTEEVGDYVVASRSLGWLVVTFTMYASVLSGVGMAGIPGTVYSVGVPFIVAVLTGHTIAVMLLSYFGPRIWILGNHYRFTTPGDLLGEYYQSDTIRIYTVVASVLFNIAYIVAQLLAGGILLNVLSGNVIPLEAGIVIIAVVVMVHVAMAGLRGIAWLDCFNGLLILSLLFFFGFTIIMVTGGPSAVLAGLGDLKEKFIAIPGVVGVFTPSYIIGVAIGLSVGPMVFAPSAWIRMYSARSKEHFAKIASLMLALWFVSHVVGTYFIGGHARSVLPNVENPDFVSSLLAFGVLPVFLAALFLIAILAAIISTTDTYIHTLTATVVRDFVRAVIFPEMDESLELKLNRVVMVAFATIGVLLALLNPVLITPLAIFGGGITLQLLTPLLGAVTWSRASTEAALVAPAVGIVLTLVWELGIVPNPVPTSLFPGLATAFFINVFLFVVISYLTRPQAPEKVEQFHGLIAHQL
ncbi:sodium:solute symporter family protein [Acidobacteria bacterium AH-259-D05]|nr:sodium:solute symporter family protein [Acidobacteria bacterium AH-259-D05]